MPSDFEKRKRRHVNSSHTDTHKIRCTQTPLGRFFQAPHWALYLCLFYTFLLLDFFLSGLKKRQRREEREKEWWFEDSLHKVVRGWEELVESQSHTGGRNYSLRTRDSSIFILRVLYCQWWRDSTLPPTDSILFGDGLQLVWKCVDKEKSLQFFHWHVVQLWSDCWVAAPTCWQQHPALVIDRF